LGNLLASLASGLPEGSGEVDRGASLPASTETGGKDGAGGAAGVGASGAGGGVERAGGGGAAGAGGAALGAGGGGGALWVWGWPGKLLGATTPIMVFCGAAGMAGRPEGGGG
jgi:hypothetical protein